MPDEDFVARVLQRWRESGELAVLLREIGRIRDAARQQLEAQLTATIAADGRGVAILAYQQGMADGVARVYAVLEATAQAQPVPPLPERYADLTVAD